MSFLSEHNLLIFLLQFALLLGLSKLAGLIFEKFKQSTITAEVLVGLILGPVIFGKFSPHWHAILFPDDPLQIAMLETIAWFGNFYLLMETGLGVNFARIWKQRGKAVTIALADIIVPMALLIIPIFLLPSVYLIDPGKRVLFSFFIASVLTISALPVAIRVMYDLNIIKSDMGFLTISALSINDIIGWVLITILMSLFGQASLQYGFALKLILFTVAFTIISLTLFKNLIDRIMTHIHNRLGDNTGYKTTFVFLVGMLFGAATLKIGIHSLFGFFIAGMVIGEAKHFSENDRHVMNRLVHSVFVPIFFASIGLRLDLINNFDWKLVLFITVISIVAKFIGALIGAWIAKQDKFDRLLIAICHTSGGEMQIVVSILAFTSGLISAKIFVGIVASSIISTVFLGPWLAYALKMKRKGLLGILFNKDSILLNTEYASKDDLISQISPLIAERCGQEPQTVLNEILLREEQMSTAVGKGIAFPHARLKGLSHPVIFAVRNSLGLEWDSPDDKPVQWVFFIITPESNPTVQLSILQMLAKALGNKDLKDKIDVADNPLAIWEALSPNMENCDSCIMTT
jgi:Kef-type K+ transport system membrane component KefB/mannitol/fructose-specific phosphotransferase system IIA component (Ntr-type)